MAFLNSGSRSASKGDGSHHVANVRASSSMAGVEGHSGGSFDVFSSQSQINSPANLCTDLMSGISSNFLFNPNMSHSIFSAKNVNRDAFRNSDWVIDTADTNHMVHSINLFPSITTTLNTFVNLPNGESALVTHIGTVKISENLVLSNVLCVPSFNFNLISVSQLAKSILCCLIFFGNLCFIQDLAHWSTIGLGKEINGLFLLVKVESASTSNYVSFFISANKVLPHIWHARLGHISDAKLALLNKNNVHCINSNANFHCDICPLAKQKRLPFNISTTFSNECFDLLHCDIWAPFSVPTNHGCRFFLTIVDDCSRCTWVYLLKHKSQTASFLDQFCTRVETQFARKVKCIRLDNGTEFFLKDFFTKRGILHQLSCVETP